MTKSTPDVSTCSLFKSYPEAFISPLFFKNYFTLGRGQCPLPDLPRLGAMLPHIIWLTLGFLTRYAPGSLVLSILIPGVPNELHFKSIIYILSSLTPKVIGYT